MHDYRLFIFDHNGQITGSAKASSASSDEDAIAQAEALRGSLPAELLDVADLRIVACLNGGTASQAPH